jgi:AraC-like DNA-binding protein
VEYREFVPRSPLRDYVRCIWTLRSKGGGLERVLPDGTCEIVLNRGDPFRHDGRVQPRAMVVGQMPRFMEIEPTGAVELVGIRFRPGGLFPFLSAPMSELTGGWADLGDIDRRLRRELEGVRGPEEALLERLRPANGAVAAAVAAIERGGRRIDRIARDLALHPRRLERMFRREVGVAPKLLARIARFQGVLRGSGDWATVAQACGYYDQAHLIRDFKEFAGEPPTAYFGRRHPMSDAFTGG